MLPQWGGFMVNIRWANSGEFQISQLVGENTTEEGLSVLESGLGNTNMECCGHFRVSLHFPAAPSSSAVLSDIHGGCSRPRRDPK